MLPALALLTTTLLAAPSTALTLKNRPYDVLEYKLEVRLADDGSYQNRLAAKLKALRPMSTIELDAYGFTIFSTSVDGAGAAATPKYDPASHTGTLLIKPARPVAAGKEVIIEIAYSGKASTSEEGFFVKHTGNDTALPYFFTSFEPNYAQQFYPCNDQPADKATFELTAVVNEQYTVISNGRKIRDEKFAEGGRNLRRVTWLQDKPHSPYLEALAVGQFEAVEASRDIPATIWVMPGTRDRAFAAVDALKPLYNFMVGFTGTPYPWAKLDVVAHPKASLSGMEHTSMIVERESKLVLDHKNDQARRLVIAGLLAHEMAHQWFGNDVTCAWWTGTWLNEGFATYLGEAAEDDYNDNDAREVGRVESIVTSYFREERGPHSHALEPAKVLQGEQMFDSTNYIKGAQVLRMLETWLGKAEMKKVLKAYLAKYEFGSATSADFFRLAGEVTQNQKQIGAFKESWLKKKGYPVIYPQASYANNRLTVKVRQQPNRSDEKGPFVFKLPIVIHRNSEPSFSKEELITIDKSEVTVTFDVPAAPEWVNWNKNASALAEINSPSVAEEQWALSARYDPDPAWRVLAAWTLLGEIVNPEMKEETKPTATAMEAVVDVLTKDPSSYVRAGVLDRLLMTRFKRLPTELSEPIYALAKKPAGLADDAIGAIVVRREALKALGKTGFAEGHQYLIDELGGRELDVNYLEGFAAGAAMINTSSSIATLRTALTTQKSRGYPYYRRTAEAVGYIASPDAIGLVRLVLQDADNELAQGVAYKLDDNHTLKNTDEFAQMVRDVASDEKGLSIQLRLQVLGLLDDVKNDAAKAALMAISEKAVSAQIKAAAKHTLDANFPLKKK